MVMGSNVGITIWTGTAFDCSDRNDQIVLLHSRFMFGGTFDTCNNRAIVVRSLGVEDSYYTSQLNVTISSALNGRNITCISDHVSRQIVQFTTTIKTGIA